MEHKSLSNPYQGPASGDLKGGPFSPPESPAERRCVVRYPATVVFGEGAVDAIGEQARRFGRRCLVVANAAEAVREATRVDHVVRLLEGSGLEVAEFSLEGSPDVQAVARCAGTCVDLEADVVIGLGGGSVIDVAKAGSAVAANGGSWEDYQTGSARLERPVVPVIAVPTTAGAGAEATAVAVIHNAALGVIKSVSDPRLLPAVAIVDPSLTWGCPARLTAVVGLDAITHAIESYLSPKANSLTRTLSLRAVQLLVPALERVMDDPGDAAVRHDLSLGSHLAGQALAAGVGLAHILAQPISAVLRVSHGEAIAAVLTAVSEFNEEAGSPLFADLMPTLGASHRSTTDALRSLLVRLDLPTTLGDIGGSDDCVDRIVAAVLRSTAHIWTNVRPVHEEDLTRILVAALQR
jgi:alcohol dehydrogenase class IV